MRKRSKKKRVVFMGTDQIGVSVLEYLNQQFSVVLIVTAPPGRIGRGRKKIRQSPIHRKALKLKLPILAPEKLGKEAIEKINKAKPDFILVYAYGKIIPLKDLECSEIINIHPSLLPKLRGPSPIRYAILRGYRETGVSLMKIDQEIDHGPVIAQQKIVISPRETYLDLRKKAEKTALELVKKSLADCLGGKLKPKAQDHSQATFTPLIKKEDGEIDWDQDLEMIERKIRAFNPWPGTFTFLDGQIFKIYSGEIKGDKLILGQVQLAGRKKIDFEEFRRGYRGKLDFIDKIA